MKKVTELVEMVDRSPLATLGEMWRSFFKRSDQPNRVINQVKRSPTGFTLIELLVVIAIIGILATFGVANFLPSQARARDARRKNDLDQIKKALRIYYNDYNGYPSTSGGNIVGCGDAVNPANCVWGASWVRGGMTYMRILPQNPRGSNYTYYAGSSCGSGVHDFRLVAVLENTSDQDILESHNRCDNNCGLTWDGTNQNQYVVCAD